MGFVLNARLPRLVIYMNELFQMVTVALIHQSQTISPPPAMVTPKLALHTPKAQGQQATQTFGHLPRLERCGGKAAN